MHVAPRDFHVTLKPLHLFQIPAFSEAIDRPAAAYINDPSAKPLFDILTLLRLGLTVALSKEKRSTTNDTYPSSPIPNVLLEGLEVREIVGDGLGERGILAADELVRVGVEVGGEAGAVLGEEVGDEGSDGKGSIDGHEVGGKACTSEGERDCRAEGFDADVGGSGRCSSLLGRPARKGVGVGREGGKVEDELRVEREVVW
jgi:hypothetical protein